jgi:hypothetical protein
MAKSFCFHHFGKKNLLIALITRALPKSFLGPKGKAADLGQQPQPHDRSMASSPEIATAAKLDLFNDTRRHCR